MKGKMEKIQKDHRGIKILIQYCVRGKERGRGTGTGGGTCEHSTGTKTTQEIGENKFKQFKRCEKYVPPSRLKRRKLDV